MINVHFSVQFEFSHMYILWKTTDRPVASANEKLSKITYKLP